MTCPKSVRTAAIVSQVFIVLWAALSFFASVYQKPLLYEFFLRDESTLDAAGKVWSWSSVAFCLGGLLFTAANLFMCTGKCKTAPVAVSAAVLGLLPIAANGLSLLQIAVTEGADKYVVLTCYDNIVSALSYLLYAGAIITVAAAAVYAYAKNREKEESGESDTYYTE